MQRQSNSCLAQSAHLGGSGSAGSESKDGTRWGSGTARSRTEQRASAKRITIMSRQNSRRTDHEPHTALTTRSRGVPLGWDWILEVNIRNPLDGNCATITLILCAGNHLHPRNDQLFIHQAARDRIGARIARLTFRGELNIEGYFVACQGQGRGRSRLSRCENS